MNKTKKLLLSLMMVLTLVSGSSVVYATETTSTTSSNSTEAEQEKAPVYDVTVKIVPERGWLVSTTKVQVKVIDNENTGTFCVKKIEAKIGTNGTWQDITSTGYIEVAENCTVYAQVTDAYGTVYSQARYLDGYDTTPPTFNVAINNGVINIEAHDTESGVDCIYINGYKFKPNKKGILKVRLQKFDATYANFSIYVTDQSGNESDPFVIDNPYYKPDTGNDEDDTPNPAESLPTDATASTTGESSATITSATDENGDDISEEVAGKQFYSVVTKNGQQFYIVIDMTGGEYFEGSADTPASTTGTVYFLTYLSNNDLLNVTADGEVTLPYNSVAAGNAIDDETVSKAKQETTEETTEETEKEKEKKSDDDSPIIYIILAVVAFIVVFVGYRSKKSGKAKTDIIDEDTDESEDQEEAEDDGIEITAENYEEFKEHE